ncbi:MAG: hypothetical protein LBR34_02240 [Prevotella sp.]|jgi:exonuclease SbcC|nr:hypothetical protein [Prevotella sp.]
MRIIIVRFKNINSLADEWEIDFSLPQFSENGLFVITGKTGSGKSSILDAVSLALYGKTPRFPDIKNNPIDEVMTRGAKDSYAEVEFEVNHKIYRSSWKIERNRNGNLNPVRRNISDENNVILAEQIKSCDAKIVEILGLTFEQFTKVILLAQGSFAAFLQADKADKGELLEQITGTEIYGEISKRVFERCRSENRKLENISIELSAVKVLPEEEVGCLQKEIAEIEEQKTALEKELLSVETARKWLNDLADLRKQIDASKDKLPNLENAVNVANSALQNAEHELKLLKEEQERVTALFVKVRELDTKIAEKNSMLNPLTEAINALENEISQSKDDLTAKRIDNEQIAKVLHEKTSLANDKSKALQSLKSELAELLGGKQIADYQAEKERIIAFGKEIANMISTIKQLISSRSEIEKNEKIIIQNSAMEEELSESLAAEYKSLKAAESQIALLQENILLAKTVQSLEQHRQSLEDGKECPLCGATEHPFAKGNAPRMGDREKELKSLQEHLSDMQKQISTSEKRFAKTGSDRENAQKNKALEENKLIENRKKLEIILSETVELEHRIPAITEDGNSMDDLEKIRQAELEKYNRINCIVENAVKTESAISSLRDIEIPKINSEIDVINNKIVDLRIAVTALSASITEKDVQLKTQCAERERVLNERRQLENVRKELFGDKIVDMEEKRLKKAVDDKEQVKNASENAKNAAFAKLTEIKAVIAQNEKRLSENQSKEITGKTLDELQKEWDEKKTLSDELSQKTGANRQALETNRRNYERNRQILAEKDKQQAVCDKWQRLNVLIGSADGKKYRNFAQALTFENLISLSNRQLRKMSERYILKRVGDAANPFELSVIDKFQNCDERTVQNLSGGEKFIVSLALALGLANMASRNMRIDTMFIDEGFGTLDSDYLDVALSVLSNLQNEGKLIGVISHLTELKERIATHIEVTPQGGGHSKIEIKTEAGSF